ncbi:MAG: hypothetical protein AAGU32_11580, partial [Bacillota bacterium]
MEDLELKACINCTLSDNIPSVHINDEGLCNYCLQRNKKENSHDNGFSVHENQIAEALEAYRHLPYQVVMAYSGGKDSTFTMCQLKKKFNVSILAVILDNGFLTEQSQRNIHTVTAHLGVDSIIVKPSFSKLAQVFNLAASKEIFPRKSLERASSICTACIGIVKSMVNQEAMLRRIPFVCFGWTPGQAQVKSPILKLDHRMMIANQKQIKDPIVNHLGANYNRYFLDPEWIEAEKEHIPSLLYPLVFSHYNEGEIMSEISSIGWKKPQNTDTNSTNCLLNSYANFIHMRDYGYSPYSLEIAGLVREGFLSREEGLEKLSRSGDDAVINYVKRELDQYAAIE